MRYDGGFAYIPHHKARVMGQLKSYGVKRAQVCPVLVAGSGVVISRAWDELIQLAEQLSIPVATSLGGKGSIPEDHPLSMGVVGKYSRKSANEIVMKSDLVVFIGSRVGAMVTDVYKVPKPGTPIIHIDIAPDAVGRSYETEVSMVADAKLALRALVDHITEKKISRGSSPWANEARRITEQWRREFESVAMTPSLPIKPQMVMKTLRESLGKNDVVVADTGYMAAWTGALFDVLAAGRTYMRAAGSLGWAFPASIGVKLAAPDRNVVCVIGDGGIGYHISELETALRLKVPVVVLVLNNSSLAYVDHDKYLTQGYEKIAGEVADFLDVDFGKVASAFGAYGRRVERGEELKDTLEEALDSAKPAVIDVVVDKKEIAPVTDYEQALGRKI